MKRLNLQGLAQKLGRILLVSAVVTVAVAGTAASAQIVDNGFFEDNATSFSSYAGGGYGYYGPETITGFSESIPANGAGLNGYDVHYNGNVQTPFRPTGYSASASTDPRDFAFIQNTGDSLTQTLQNLSFLSIYKVTFLVGERGTDTDNVGTVSVAGNGSTGGTASVTGQYQFTAGSFTFDTGLNTNGFVLTLANTTPSSVSTNQTTGNPSGDRDVDFGDIVITQIGRTGYIPEPSSYVLLGVGALGLLVAHRRARKA